MQRVIRTYVITIYTASKALKLTIKSGLEQDEMHDMVTKLFEDDDEVLAVSTQKMKGEIKVCS